MLSSNLTLKNVAGSDVVFNAFSFNSTGVKRIDVASDADTKGYLNIQHSSSGTKVSKVDRHLIQFVKTQADDNGNPFSATVNLTVAVADNAVITQAIVEDLLRELFDLLSTSTTIAVDSTIVGQILRGES